MGLAMTAAPIPAMIQVAVALILIATVLAVMDQSQEAVLELVVPNLTEAPSQEEVLNPAEAPSQGAVRSPAEAPKPAMVRSLVMVPKPAMAPSPAVIPKPAMAPSPAEVPKPAMAPSPAEAPKTAMVRSPAVIPKPEKKRSPVVQIKRLEAIQMKVRTKPRNLQKKPKNPKKRMRTAAIAAGGNRPAGPDVPESTEAELETLPAEVLSKPEDEKEAREPEDFYDDLIEEPEGELVQFNDRYRTYQTGDGEYITVVGGYSGLYQDTSGEVLEANNMLTEADVEDEEISVATGSNARRMRSMVSGGTTYRNEDGPINVLLPEKMSGGRGYTISKGSDSLEIIPEGGDYTLSCVGDNAIRYSDVYENVDVQYTILNGTVKEDIILLEKQEKDSFSYKLKSGSLKSRKKVIRLSPITQAPAILCSV